MSANTNSRLMSRAEVEAEYGITRRFLEVAAVKGGGPKFVKVGRLCRYRRADVDAWIEMRTVESTSEEPGVGA